nr:unnamed protein product [Callosobruchus analis]
MRKDAYLELLQLVTLIIKKLVTNMRKGVAPHERLRSCLLFMLWYCGHFLFHGHGCY